MRAQGRETLVYFMATATIRPLTWKATRRELLPNVNTLVRTTVLVGGYLLDARCVCWGVVPSDLQIAGKENGKKAVLHKVKNLDQASSNDGPVCHVGGDIRLLGKFDIPEQEANKGDGANDEHRDEGAFLPAARVERPGQ